MQSGSARHRGSDGSRGDRLRRNFCPQRPAAGTTGTTGPTGSTGSTAGASAAVGCTSTPTVIVTEQNNPNSNGHLNSFLTGGLAFSPDGTQLYFSDYVMNDHTKSAARYGAYAIKSYAMASGATATVVGGSDLAANPWQSTSATQFTGLAADANNIYANAQLQTYANSVSVIPLADPGFTQIASEPSGASYGEDFGGVTVSSSSYVPSARLRERLFQRRRHFDVPPDVADGSPPRFGIS